MPLWKVGPGIEGKRMGGGPWGRKGQEFTFPLPRSSCVGGGGRKLAFPANFRGTLSASRPSPRPGGALLSLTLLLLIGSDDRGEESKEPPRVTGCRIRAHPPLPSPLTHSVLGCGAVRLREGEHDPVPPPGASTRQRRPSRLRGSRPLSSSPPAHVSGWRAGPPLNGSP